MEKPSSEQIGVLVEQFINLLDIYKPIALGMQVQPVDAFFTYRLLLRRNPDPLIELPYILSNPLPFREFLRRVIDSPEFRDTGGVMPVGQLLMAEVEGFRFWFNTGDREMGVLMGFGLYEPQSVAFLKKLVKPGMKCLDIGAQTGFYTCLLAACVGDGGKIYAFEPMPSSCELLNRNIRENHFEDRVVIFPFAASNAPTHLEGSFVSNMYVVGDVPGADKVTMETIRIDDIVKDRVDLIKMDVEGHEPAVVEGMRGLIMRDRPILLTEVGEYYLQTLSHTCANDYLGLLLSLGYNVFTLEDMETPLKSGDLNLDILGSMNVVAFPC
jgi:FkbM family methyltransferase